ncbi:MULTISPECIES: MFS transporter [Xenorhabdus]|uniref:MFS transporter n=1 Tax=Xenorhabdus TaxID=626 RepID=UPI00064A678A|nr:MULTISPECIES: MFS transporter [Xenorhabdus]KLU15826.1 MFS transporter [Xenorhabdus griffiniae]KOP34706.1 MFS transporter [Xenorhabdus sp. GDc328]
MKSHLIFSVSFFLSFVNFLIFYSYPFRLETLGVENGVAGLVVGTATIFTLIMRVISGIVIDKFRLKRAMLTTAILYSLSLLLINGDWEFTVIAGRLGLGGLLGIMSTLLMYYTLTVSDDRAEKSRNVSMFTFFNALPTCLAPFIALKMAQIWGVNSVTVLAVILFFFCLLLVLLLDIQTISIGGGDGSTEEGFSESLRCVIADKNVRASIMVLSLIYVISGTTVTFLPTYFLESGMNDPSWYFLVFTLCMMLPRLLLKKHMPQDSIFPSRLLMICVTLGLAGNLANYLLTNNQFVLVGAVCNGMTLGIIYPVVMSYVVCCVGRNLSGTLSSVVAAAADLGVILSNIGLGILSVSISDDIAMMFPVIASATALLIVYLRMMVQPRNIKRRTS